MEKLGANEPNELVSGMELENWNIGRCDDFLFGAKSASNCKYLCFMVLTRYIMLTVRNEHFFQLKFS